MNGHLNVESGTSSVVLSIGWAEFFQKFKNGKPYHKINPNLTALILLWAMLRKVNSIIPRNRDGFPLIRHPIYTLGRSLVFKSSKVLKILP